MSDLKSLGYITSFDQRHRPLAHFAFGVLGFAEGKGPDPSALYLRMDERAARLIVVPGDTEQVLTIGWEVRDRPALQRVKAPSTAPGVAFKQLPRKRPTPAASKRRSPSRTRPAPRSRCSTAPCSTTAP